MNIEDIDILEGDCLELLKDVPSRSVDMVLCDLPYGTTACAWDTIIPLAPLWEEYGRVVKEGSPIVLTASQPFTSLLVMSNVKWFKHEWIWKKNAGSNFGTVKFQPMKEHESVLVFGKGRVNYFPQMQERAEAGKAMVKAGVKSKMTNNNGVYGTGKLNQRAYDNSKQDPTMRVPSSVQAFNRERGLHPTQKPLGLFKYLIQTYSQPGDTVLDNCLGSGTSALACLELGRKCIGMEKDAGYIGVTMTRLAEALCS